MKKKKTIILTAVVGVALLAAAGMAMQAGLGQKVATAQAVRGELQDWYTEEGTISLGGEYYVMAEVSGPVGELLAAENDHVEAGDILFTIDASDYKYEKTLAESTLAGYEAQLEQTRIGQVMTASPQEYIDSIRQQAAASEAQYQAARSVYEADQSLYAAGDISRVQLETDTVAYEAALLAWEQAKGRYEESSRLLESLAAEGIGQATINQRFYDSEQTQLTAAIQAQQAMIDQLSDQIEKCQVKAERESIVTSLPAEKLSYIQAGTTAAVLGGGGELYVEADVLTNIAPYLQAGDPAKAVLKLRGRNVTYNGTVTQVYDYAQKGTSSLGLDEYRVHVKVKLEEQEDMEAKEGYGVDLQLLMYQSDDCLTVPAGAVFRRGDQDYVYQISGGRARAQEIEVAYRTATQAVIAAGLEEGDTVIDQVGTEGIYEGAKVRK